jgi:shikimate kinase
VVPKSNIVLSGFMASGKNTVGSLLSGMTGMPLIDTDSLVQEDAGKTIKEIFAQEGETRFRELERTVIARESGREDVVLAVGGGAVLDPDNVRELKSRGVIYFLEVTPEEVAKRAGGDERRPLLADELHEIESLMAARESGYRRAADVVVSTSGRAPEDIASCIATDFESRHKACLREPPDGC